MITRSSPNKKPNKLKVLGLSSLVLLITGGLLWKGVPNQTKTKDLSSYIISAESGTLPGLITASGVLQSEKRVNVSPKRQGVIEEIFVDIGQRVQRNQLIAKMDDRDLLFRLDELKADYESQKANYDRRKFLFQEGAISLESYEEYKKLFLKSEARLRQLEVEKNELKVRAPFNGVITSKYVVPGAYVTPSPTKSSLDSNSSNTSIVELSQGLEVVAKVPESDIGRIKVGQKASIRVDSFPDQRFNAKVKEISPRAIKNNNVTSFEVTLLLDIYQKALRIGMTADIEFKTGETELRTLVPTVSVVTREGIPGLLLVGKNDEPEFRAVDLGTSSGSKTAIISGINPGDQIFIDLPPWAKLRDE